MSTVNLPVSGSSSQQIIAADTADSPSTVMMRGTSGESAVETLTVGTGLVNEGYDRKGIAAKSANFNAGDKGTYIVTTAASTIVASLPAAASSTGMHIVFIKKDNGAGKIQLDGSGSETINGATTFDGTATQYKRIEVECDGTEWYAKEA